MAIPLPELMHQLTLNHLTLTLVGCNEIEVRGRLQSLTPALRAGLRKHKPTLLSILADLSPLHRETSIDHPLVAELLSHGFVVVGESRDEDELLARHGLKPVPWPEEPMRTTYVAPAKGVVAATELPKGWTNALNLRYEYIGNATKRLKLAKSLFANPFSVGKHNTIEQSLEKYRNRLLDSPLLRSQARAQLSGKILVCSCKPDRHRDNVGANCHGDILAEYLLDLHNEHKRAGAKLVPSHRP